jgi:hemerythrin-like domain-containing protein
MSARKLEAARERLTRARDAVDGDAEERLETALGTVERAVEEGRTLDHGALARLTRTLEEVAEDAEAEAEETLLDAKAAISNYREDVPGA